MAREVGTHFLENSTDILVGISTLLVFRALVPHPQRLSSRGSLAAAPDLLAHSPPGMRACSFLHCCTHGVRPGYQAVLPSGKHFAANGALIHGDLAAWIPPLSHGQHVLEISTFDIHSPFPEFSAVL